jgi:hypothetical protein
MKPSFSSPAVCTSTTKPRIYYPFSSVAVSNILAIFLYVQFIEGDSSQTFDIQITNRHKVDINIQGSN